MKKFLVRRFLKKVKFDYFFRFLNLSFVSRIFFKRLIKFKFGCLNNINIIEYSFNRKLSLMNRFSFLFFRVSFSLQKRSFNFEEFNSKELSFGFFSKNVSNRMSVVPFMGFSNYFFFFNSLKLIDLSFNSLFKLAKVSYLCETLNARVYKLIDWRFLISSVRFFNKNLSISWLGDFGHYNLFCEKFFISFNTISVFLFFYSFIYHFLLIFILFIDFIFSYNIFQLKFLTDNFMCK